jgi:hypothetical protein
MIQKHIEIKPAQVLRLFGPTAHFGRLRLKACEDFPEFGLGRKVAWRSGYDVLPKIFFHILCAEIVISL